jgi:hypothetical protein
MSMARMYRYTLFCSVPVGVAGVSPVEFLGAPEASEVRLLMLATLLVGVTAHWIFRRWGKSATAGTTAAGVSGSELAGETLGDVTKERRRGRRFTVPCAAPTW